ncbi:ATP-binding cassette domain-containing protein [Deltaproteobacteria bacterium TL4]
MNIPLSPPSGKPVKLAADRTIFTTEEPKKIILQYENVSFSYNRPLQVLTDVNLSFRQGEAVSISGPNGSGKTTLLKLAIGLLLPATGTVQLDQELLNKKTRRDAFRKIGYLFQNSEDQLFCPTVGEDVAFGPMNMGLEKEEVRERVQYALALMKITHLEKRPIHHLSGGEMKRSALAGLLAMKPKVMVLDEPTNGLDPGSAKAIIELLHSLNEEHGYTLLVVTHAIDRIPEFANRSLLLKNGMVFRDGSVAEVLTDIDALREIEIEPPVITQYFYRKRKGFPERTLPLTLDQACKLQE